MNDLDYRARSSRKMSQQQEQQSLVGRDGATEHYQPDSFGHPCQDSISGMVPSKALSHSGPPALIRPSSVSHFEPNTNSSNSISGRNQHIDETSSVISFTSSVHSLNYDSASVTSSSAGYNHPLGIIMKNHNVVTAQTNNNNSMTHQTHQNSSLKTCGDLDKLSRDLLAMSSSPANYSRMRTVPVISSMVQLLHQPSNQNICDQASLGSEDNFSNRQSRDVRARVARALHNMVHIHPNDKHYKKEGKVLKLLENLRMYADVLRDLTLSLKELDKENCDPSKDKEDEELAADNTDFRIPEQTTSEKTDPKSMMIPIQERERMIKLLGSCNSIKVATVRNLNSPTGKDLMVLCENNDNKTSTAAPISLGSFLFKFPCRNFVNYLSDLSMGIHTAGCADDDDRDVDSGIISMEDNASYGNIMDPEYREVLIAKFQNIQNFWTSLNIEETMAWLTKWSFDEGHRQPIELLGGIPALAEFVEIEWEAHQYICQSEKLTIDNSQSSKFNQYQKMLIRCNNCSKSCIEVRRYAVVALTNMTFGKANIKSFLCNFPGFIQLMVSQLKHQDKTSHELPCPFHAVAKPSASTSSLSPSSIENLRKATAHLFRNLAWKADKNSKQLLSESEVVGVLLQSAIDVTIAAFSIVDKCLASKHDIISSTKVLPKEAEPFLKVILSALWNLSAHCRKNKSDICDMEGGLSFLAFLLRQTQAGQIVESSGGILRNISSFIATSSSTDNYRQILRNSGCLDILLQQLRSSSLTIVSNACGTLWNFSARNVEDQELLWNIGAVPMLESLTNSKHKTISTCSLAALKNLYGFKEREFNEKTTANIVQCTVQSANSNDKNQPNLLNDDEYSTSSQNNSQSTLEKRKKKHKDKELHEKLKSNIHPQIHDEDKDSCTSEESDGSDSESWNIDKCNLQLDSASRDDGSHGGISSRLSNISGSKSLSASNDVQTSSRASDVGVPMPDESTYIQKERHDEPRTYSTAPVTFTYSQREQFNQDGLMSPSFSVPTNSSHSGMSPVLTHNPLKQRQFDGRFTNYMKQYQPPIQHEIPETSSNIVPSQNHQLTFTAQQLIQQSSSFNELLSPSKLPYLSFNATTSSPLYSVQNNLRQNDSFNNRIMREETGDECIDECPTDYSLRFQENEETDLQGIPRNVINEGVHCEKGGEENALIDNEDDDQERNCRAYDDVKTYCIEETPYDTPCMTSHAGSVTDLRDNNAISSDEEEEEKPNIKASTTGIPNNNVPMIAVNVYRNYNLEDDDDLEDEAELNRPKVFCTEDTPGIFSRADSISSLSSDGEDMLPTETERQQVIQRGISIPGPGESISTNMINTLDTHLKPEKGELETNDSLAKEKQTENLKSERESLTPPRVFHDTENFEGKTELERLSDDHITHSNSETTNATEYNPQIHHHKHVKFNPQETPLMYSRASSPESLASCDIHEGYKDVYSSYEHSRATSGRVSPSDLPDSPCQSRPRSPPPKPLLSNKKPQQTMKVVPSCNFIHDTSNSAQNTSKTMHSRQGNYLIKEKATVNEEKRSNAHSKVTQHTMHGRNQDHECEEEEEEVKCYADEGETPARFSPLSRLTFSDEEKEGQKQTEFPNHNTSNSKVIHYESFYVIYCNSLGAFLIYINIAPML